MGVFHPLEIDVINRTITAYCVINDILVQLQIIVKVNVVFILYSLGLIYLNKKNISLLVLLF